MALRLTAHAFWFYIEPAEMLTKEVQASEYICLFQQVIEETSDRRTLPLERSA